MTLGASFILLLSQKNIEGYALCFYTSRKLTHSILYYPDLDNDGDNDLLTANSSSNPYNISILLNNGSGSFSAPTNFGVAAGPRSICAFDLDGDGDNDVASGNSAANNVSILLNRQISCSYIPGDINGDGYANASDVTYAVNYFRGGGPPPPSSSDCHPPCNGYADPFYAPGDVNGTCTFNAIDITYYVDYLQGQHPSLLYCTNCRPTNYN